MNSYSIRNVYSQFRAVLGSHRKILAFIDYIFMIWGEDGFYFFFLTRLLYYKTNKTFPLRKAQDRMG